MTTRLRKLEYFETELEASEQGRDILRLVRSHMREVTELVNHNRAVTLAWQRNKGPRFLMSAMDSGFDEHSPVQKEIEGVTLQRLLLRMGDAIQQAGSRELAADVARYAAPILTAAAECASVSDLFARIRDGTLTGSGS